MNRISNKSFAIALASMVGASTAIAGPASEWQYIGEFQPATSSTGLATGPFQSTAGLGTHFDASSWSGSASSTATSRSVLSLDAQTAAAVDASAVAVDERRHALASVANASPVVGSPASLELTLLNFINSIRAQQVGNPFVQLQTAATNIDITINDVPAPVPLPAGSWLFGAGLAAAWVMRRVIREHVDSDGARAFAAT